MDTGEPRFKPTFQALAHGDFVYRHSNVPIIVGSADTRLFDSEGRAYLAAEAANGTAGLGFDASILEESVEKVRGLPAVPSFCETDIRLRVAKKIANLMYQATGEQGRVSFELGGAQAMELALKIARANSRGAQYVVFEGGYHGRSAFMSQFSASHRYRRATGDWRIPVVRLPFPDCEQCRFGQIRASCSHECVSYLRSLVSSEFAGLASANGPPDIGAFIFEPILNAGGIVKPDATYIQTAIDTFRNLGALIVADEIFCGFHRTGPAFGFMHYGVTPDIVVISKALTNGISPLSCVWAKSHLLDEQVFPPGSHSATYLNYAFGLALADTVIDRYESWHDRKAHISMLEERLRRLVDNVATDSSLVVSGTALGGLARLLLRAPIASKVNDIARRIFFENPVEGIHGAVLASTGMSPNVIAINPPLNIGAEHLAVLELIIKRSLAEVT